MFLYCSKIRACAQRGKSRGREAHPRRAGARRVYPHHRHRRHPLGGAAAVHHVSQQHLKRYLAEFDFRYNERVSLGVNDSERMAKSIAGIVGKRLTYRRTRQQAQIEDNIPF
jgi:hypothetical protein